MSSINMWKCISEEAIYSILLMAESIGVILLSIEYVYKLLDIKQRVI